MVTTVSREMRYSKKIDEALEKYRISRKLRFKNAAVQELISEGLAFQRSVAITKLWNDASKRHGFSIDAELDEKVRSFAIEKSMTYQQAYFECMCLALEKHVGLIGHTEK